MFFKGDRILFIKEYRRSIPKYEMKNVTMEGSIIDKRIEIIGVDSDENTNRL